MDPETPAVETPAAPPVEPPATPPDPATPPVVDPPATTQPTPEQFAALAKAEAEIQQMKRDGKTSGTEMERLKALEQSFKDDPYAAMEAAGGSMEHYANRILGDGKPGADEEKAALIKRLDDLESAAKARDESDAKQSQQTEISGHVGEIRGIMEGDAETYTPINQTLELYSAIEGVPVEALLQNAVGAYIQRAASGPDGKVLTPAESVDILLGESTKAIDRMVNSVLQNESLKKLFLEKLSAAPAATPPATPAQPRQTLTPEGETESEPVDMSKLTHDEKLLAMARIIDAQKAKLAK